MVKSAAVNIHHHRQIQTGHIRPEYIQAMGLLSIRQVGNVPINLNSFPGGLLVF
jgi:hypothetical protein